MKGKVESGQLCTVEPIEDFGTLTKNDIVLCKVNGNEYLHLIKAIKGGGFRSETIVVASTVGLEPMGYSAAAQKLKTSS